MAAVAVGDFEDQDAIVAMDKQHMGKCKASDQPGEAIPRWDMHFKQHEQQPLYILN